MVDLKAHNFSLYSLTNVLVMLLFQYLNYYNPHSFSFHTTKSLMFQLWIDRSLLEMQKLTIEVGLKEALKMEMDVSTFPFLYCI